MKNDREIRMLINDMIRKLKQNGLNPPYCIISRKEIDISKHPEITKIKIDPEVSGEGDLFLYPCNVEITRSNLGLYAITYIPV